MNRDGQSLVEYMMVATALILMALALAPGVRAAAMGLMWRAQAQVTSPSATADSIIPSL